MQTGRLSERVRDKIRQIAESTSLLKVSNGTGVPYSCLHRFVRGAGVRSDTLDQLVEFAGLWEPDSRGGRWVGK